MIGEDEEEEGQFQKGEQNVFAMLSVLNVGLYSQY
jgi:hypothetical protein